MQASVLGIQRSRSGAVEHVGDAFIEAFDHAVGLLALQAGQAVLDAQLFAQRVKLMLTDAYALKYSRYQATKLAIPCSTCVLGW